MLWLPMFELIAFTSSLVISVITTVFILQFSYELVKTMTRKNLETNLFFLGANMALLVMVAVVVKQTLLGGL